MYAAKPNKRRVAPATRKERDDRFRDFFVQWLQTTLSIAMAQSQIVRAIDCNQMLIIVDVKNVAAFISLQHGVYNDQ
jgi:hypothetical protein